MLKNLIIKAIQPRSSNENTRRKEFVLNILLFGAIALTSIATMATLIDKMKFGTDYIGASPLIPLIALTVQLILYTLVRKGKINTVAYIFIGIFLASALYTTYKWGTDIPQGLLLYATIIVMSGVLISSTASLVITGIISILVLTTGILQKAAVISPQIYWKSELFGTDDLLAFVATFNLMFLVAWVSNREIQHSLQRAHTSEEALQKERALLETKVEQRTKQLRETQLEKIRQIYRFADLGKLTSGVLHDLSNPLEIVSLNLGQLDNKKVSQATQAWERAVRGAKAMERYITAAQRQIQKQDINVKFNPTDEIQYVLQIFSHTAKEQNIKLLFKEANKITLTGNPVKFNQLITNLVANAVEAYKKSQKENKEIIVTLKRNKINTLVKIQDFGCGISQDNLSKIFNPFFSTKKEGIGIGLTISKEIAEKDFGGGISVKSTPEVGTSFTIKIPHV